MDTQLATDLYPSLKTNAFNQAFAISHTPFVVFFAFSSRWFLAWLFPHWATAESEVDGIVSGTCSQSRAGIPLINLRPLHVMSELNITNVSLGGFSLLVPPCDRHFCALLSYLICLHDKKLYVNQHRSFPSRGGKCYLCSPF